MKIFTSAALVLALGFAAAPALAQSQTMAPAPGQTGPSEITPSGKDGTSMGAMGNMNKQPGAGMTSTMVMPGDTGIAMGKTKGPAGQVPAGDRTPSGKDSQAMGTMGNDTKLPGQ